MAAPSLLAWPDARPCSTPPASPPALTHARSFGPRQEERKFGFSDTGRLNCEVRLTSFAAGVGLGRQAQVGGVRAAGFGGVRACMHATPMHATLRTRQAPTLLVPSS